MPRGDQTGPNGAGSMTGRQMGSCTGYKKPGFTNAGRRFNAGAGRGSRRNNFVNRPNMPRYNQRVNADDAQTLKDEIAYLEQQLATAKARYSGLNE